jgi:hypothetical protein
VSMPLHEGSAPGFEGISRQGSFLPRLGHLPDQNDLLGRMPFTVGDMLFRLEHIAKKWIPVLHTKTCVVNNLEHRTQKLIPKRNTRRGPAFGRVNP